MSVIGTGAFWAATAERAIKTFAQSMIAVYLANQATPLEVDWSQAFYLALFATGASILTSLISAAGGNPGPSLATERLTVTKTGLTGAVDPPVV